MPYMILQKKVGTGAPSSQFTTVTDLTLTDSRAISTVSKMAVSSDGNHMVGIDAVTDRIYEYSLSTSHDVTTLQEVGSRSFTNPNSVFMSPDGTKMFIGYFPVSGGTILQFNLPSPWDVANAGSATSSVNTENDLSVRAENFFIGDGGSKLYIMEQVAEVLHQFTLTTPWDLSGTIINDNKSMVVNNFISSNNPRAFAFTLDGKKILFTDITSDSIHEVSLQTPWDVSTATGQVAVLGMGVDGVTSPLSISVADNDTKVYVVCTGSDRLYAYHL